MNLAEKKLKLTKDVLEITDKKLLFQLEHLIHVYQRENDFWDHLPIEVRNEIEHAKVESKKGMGKDHKSVMKNYKQWL